LHTLSPHELPIFSVFKNQVVAAVAVAVAIAIAEVLAVSCSYSSYIN
jgi:hypothetical protein